VQAIDRVHPEVVEAMAELGIDIADRVPDVYIPMGITAENVAKKFEIARADQDAFAASSHQKAAAAKASGRFADEIGCGYIIRPDNKGAKAGNINHALALWLMEERGCRGKERLVQHIIVLIFVLSPPPPVHQWLNACQPLM
jgi:hypothetical protein